MVLGQFDTEFHLILEGKHLSLQRQALFFLEFVGFLAVLILCKSGFTHEG